MILRLILYTEWFLANTHTEKRNRAIFPSHNDDPHTIIPSSSVDVEEIGSPSMVQGSEGCHSQILVSVAQGISGGSLMRVDTWPALFCFRV